MKVPRDFIPSMYLNYVIMSIIDVLLVHKKTQLHQNSFYRVIETSHVNCYVSYFNIENSLIEKEF